MTEDLEKLFTSYLKEELRLDREGQWYHNGTAFSHKRLSQLFHRSIQWDDELQDYVIRIGRGRATFSHEGFVRFLTSLYQREDNTLIARFAEGIEEILQPEQLRINEQEEFFYLTEDRPPARCTRSAHQQLLEYAESERSLAIDGTLYTISRGTL